MFNKFALLVMGLMVTVSSAGCCGCFGHAYNSGYRGGCAPCNNGCAPSGGYYPPQQGAFFQGTDPSQTAFATGSLTQTAYATTPMQSSFAPTQSAYIPAQTAALPAGAIQGPPIYNTATIPTATLPMY